LTGRWSDYFIKHGAQFEEFWKELLGLKNRHVVFILGHGFDPRMCQAIRVIMGTGGDGLRDCIALTYDGLVRSQAASFIKIWLPKLSRPK
jgi:hypothetical protein